MFGSAHGEVKEVWWVRYPLLRHRETYNPVSSLRLATKKTTFRRLTAVLMVLGTTAALPGQALTAERADQWRKRVRHTLFVPDPVENDLQNQKTSSRVRSPDRRLHALTAAKYGRPRDVSSPATETATPRRVRIVVTEPALRRNARSTQHVANDP